ncbi:MAG: transcriptional regulator [Microbacterium sp.]|nr:transcriptional regulator [Microbacterium sp.]|tara:strand:- start:1429 stop:1782 length:354 start_codon:yes stop_codon:yes gene_type:complete
MASALPLLNTELDAAACGRPVPAEALSDTQAAALATALKALADPTRLRLMSIVAASPDGEACACDLTEPVGLSQPTVSHHLKVLTAAGFLTRTKRGTWAYFRVTPGAVDRIAALLPR